MSDVRFERAIFKEIDSLPDHYLQQIEDLTQDILLNVCVDMKLQQERDRNIVLAALQKALGVLVARGFKSDQLDSVLDNVCDSLRYNAKLWSKNG